MQILISIILLLLSLFCCSSGSTNQTDTIYKEHVEKNIYKDNASVPPISDLTFEDLINLSRNAEPEGELKQKLENQLSRVYVINRNSESTLSKPYIRIAQWNIKRGFNINVINDIFADSKTYETQHKKYVKPRESNHLADELNALTQADIVCLNEVDVGMPRTKYTNVASEFADKRNWNYAFSTEFVEVGPLFQKETVDKTQYKGLHGNVIVSRFPIVSSRVIRLPNYYDWYRAETLKKQSPIEHFRKFGAKKIFSETILHREVRHGGRSALVADIKLPNDQIITVVSTHFEDRAYSDQRLHQFKYLLANLKDIKTPVVLAGDFNTSTTDTKPTSFKKEVEKRIRDPHFILRQAAFVPIPFIPVVGGLIAVTFSKLLQYKDPFFPNIPIMFPNHERRFYTYLKKFRFSDGAGFDLSGDREHSSNGKKGLLANSNQRHWKGFKSTFKFEKPRVIAYFKLDWFFIKPLGQHFKPFNGRTLKTLNQSVKGGISDHNPITVDIKL